MTPVALDARDRRALRIGAWVAGPILVASLLVLPYGRALRAARDAVAAERSLLARELAVLRDAPHDIQVARAARRALVARSDRLFGGGDAAAASAALASYVGDAAAESGVELEWSETRTPIEGDSLVAVDIRATAEIGAAYDFLRALEDGPKLVRVERLTIARTAGRAVGDEPGIVAVTATVAGLPRDVHLGGEPAAAAAAGREAAP
ncbi:MAG TPA: type II secretion system protein GspM [Gemmatimonadaceae bacterium]